MPIDNIWIMIFTNTKHQKTAKLPFLLITAVCENYAIEWLKWNAVCRNYCAEIKNYREIFK